MPKPILKAIRRSDIIADGMHQYLAKLADYEGYQFGTFSKVWFGITMWNGYMWHQWADDGHDDAYWINVWEIV